MPSQVLALIRRLCAEVNAAPLLVTHDLQIVHMLSRTVVLSEINRASNEMANNEVGMTNK